MQVISKMCLDNSLFNFGIKSHQAPPPTHLVLFVVRRIPAQEVLISENENVSEFKVAKKLSRRSPRERNLYVTLD